MKSFNSEKFIHDRPDPSCASKLVLYPTFSRVGCVLVDNNSWARDAPLTTPIIGLKELPISKELIQHTHIQFAHCYKNQTGYASVLDRFDKGGGLLYDLEFLQDGSGRRVAAFGFHAGFAGAAAGVLALADHADGQTLKSLKPYDNEIAMITAVKERLAKSISLEKVKVLVIGALGRCGRGAVELFRRIGLQE